jgi:hypothetical protein
MVSKLGRAQRKHAPRWRPRALHLDSTDVQFIRGFSNFLLQLQDVENGSGESLEGNLSLFYQAKYCIAILFLREQLIFCCGTWVDLGPSQFENASSNQTLKAGKSDLSLQMARSQSQCMNTIIWLNFFHDTQHSHSFHFALYIGLGNTSLMRTLCKCVYEVP